MNLETKFIVPSGVIARQLSGEAIILDIESGTYFGLNEVGARIWEMLESGETLEAVCARLLEEFEVSREQLQGDVLALVDELKDRRLIEPA
jgi:hypothetical protein